MINDNNSFLFSVLTGYREDPVVNIVRPARGYIKNFVPYSPAPHAPYLSSLFLHLTLLWPFSNVPTSPKLIIIYSGLHLFLTLCSIHPFPFSLFRTSLYIFHTPYYFLPFVRPLDPQHGPLLSPPFCQFRPSVVFYFPSCLSAPHQFPTAPLSPILWDHLLAPSPFHVFSRLLFLLLPIPCLLYLADQPESRDSYFTQPSLPQFDISRLPPFDILVPSAPLRFLHSLAPILPLHFPIPVLHLTPNIPSLLSSLPHLLQRHLLFLIKPLHFPTPNLPLLCPIHLLSTASHSPVLFLISCRILLQLPPYEVIKYINVIYYPPLSLKFRLLL